VVWGIGHFSRIIASLSGYVWRVRREIPFTKERDSVEKRSGKLVVRIDGQRCATGEVQREQLTHKISKGAIRRDGAL